MRFFFLLALLIVTACDTSQITEPAQADAVTEISAPSFARAPRPGSYVTPSGATCATIFTLAYGPYNGNNAYWQSYYQTFCYETVPDPVAPAPTPTYPAPTYPRPPYVPGRAGGTKTAGNN